jgi:hypothetical protein
LANATPPGPASKAVAGVDDFGTQAENGMSLVDSCPSTTALSV